MEGLYKSERMRKVGVMSMSFDEDAYGKITLKLFHKILYCVTIINFLKRHEESHAKGC